jgi:hypothetical protein
MKSRPPDRDPDLRQALALDAEAQRALLDGMLTGIHAAPAQTTFQHVGVKVRRTERGTLSCLAIPFPDDVILTASSHYLKILIDHRALERSAPRSAKNIANLEAAIAEHAPRRGVITVPFVPPCRWTIGTVRAVIDVLVKHCPTAPKDRGSYDAGVLVGSGYAYIRVTPDSHAACHVEKDAPFTAEVRIQPEATDAIRQWRVLFPGFWGGGSLTTIDDRLRQVKQEQARRDKAANDPDDDDDLDHIEKAARRTLHGPDSLPNTSRRQHGRRFTDRHRPVRPRRADQFQGLVLKGDQPPLGSTFKDKLQWLAIEYPSVLRAIESAVDELLRELPGKDRR